MTLGCLRPFQKPHPRPCRYDIHIVASILAFALAAATAAAAATATAALSEPKSQRYGDELTSRPQTPFYSSALTGWLIPRAENITRT